MTGPIDTGSSRDMMIALTEVFPNQTFGSIPVSDRLNALEAYRMFDRAVQRDVPSALEAYYRYLNDNAS